MKQEEIQRIINIRTAHIDAANAEVALLEERRAFADTVGRELGYSSLKEAMAKEAIDVPVDVVLLKTLSRLGIRPLNRDSVLRYKAAQSRNLLNLILKTFGMPMIASGFLVILVVVIAALADNTAAIKAITFPWGAIFGLGCAMTWAEHAIVPRREWRIRDVNKNFIHLDSHFIPREALQMALDIRRALPETRFVTHELLKDYGSWFKWVEATLRAIPDPDPFLEVHFGAESYFIAVWNEPGFDGKLMQID
ncbi:MAG: hypothetical protein AAB883_01885 [Patescibacteria group bacterium]